MGVGKIKTTPQKDGQTLYQQFVGYLPSSIYWSYKLPVLTRDAGYPTEWFTDWSRYQGWLDRTRALRSDLVVSHCRWFLRWDPFPAASVWYIPRFNGNLWETAYCVNENGEWLTERGEKESNRNYFSRVTKRLCQMGEPVGLKKTSNNWANLRHTISFMALDVPCVPTYRTGMRTRLNSEMNNGCILPKKTIYFQTFMVPVRVSVGIGRRNRSKTLAHAIEKGLRVWSWNMAGNKK